MVVKGMRMQQGFLGPFAGPPGRGGLREKTRVHGRNAHCSGQAFMDRPTVP